MSKLKKMLQQQSTWKGLALIFGSGFAYLNPTLILEVGSLVAAIIGAVDVLDDEKAENE